jgi:MFS family permease
MLACAVGRFSVDPLRGRFDKRDIVRAAGAAAVGGLLLAFICSFPSPASVGLSSIGFVFTGLGISMLAPIAFSSVGQISTAPPQAASSSSAPCADADRDQDVIALELSPVHEATSARQPTDPDRANPVIERSEYSGQSVKTAASPSGSAVALVAMFAYSGSIISSPLVGVIADGTGSLRYGILFVALVLLLIFPISSHIPPDPSGVQRR